MQEPCDETPAVSPVAAIGIGARWLLVLIAALSLAAWAALASWSLSPYARYLDHGSWIDPRPAPERCSRLPGWARVVPALLHALPGC